MKCVEAEHRQGGSLLKGESDHTLTIVAWKCKPAKDPRRQSKSIRQVAPPGYPQCKVILGKNDLT